MSLSKSYQQFLGNPTASALADGASINYIPTITSIHEPSAIVKHLSAQEKQLKKKSEKVISSIESQNGLCLDVETTIEFVSGGGAYLPGLDDNFLSDRVVMFPTVHIVHFNSAGKITQIRLYWDQASLLKQCEVIGSRGRNWPVRDGKDQARLVASSVGAMSADKPAVGPIDTQGSVASSRPQSSGSSSATRGDPHASLSLFAPRNPDQEANRDPTLFPAVAPRASAKPRARDLTEIVAGGDEPELGSVRSPSPGKGGAGKHFAPNRLFDEGAKQSKDDDPERIKTNPLKYKHFEFGEPEESTQKGMEPPKTRAKSNSNSNNGQRQWNFEDFDTPEKVPVRLTDKNTKHFSWDDEDGDAPSPIRRPVVHQPRPDSQTHFEFLDDGTPRRGTLADPGRVHNKKGLGLYDDHILGAEATSSSDQKAPLRSTADMANHQRNFSSQFDIVDHHSPGGAARKPAAAANVDENSKPKNLGYRIGTAGNGMGGRKDQQKQWGIGDESEEEAEKGRVPQSRGGRSTGGKSQAVEQAGTSFWDF